MKRSTATKNDVPEETLVVDDSEVSTNRKILNDQNEKNELKVCTDWKCRKCGADSYTKCPWQRSVFIKPKGKKTEYTILDSVLSYEEILVTRPESSVQNEELRFVLSIPSYVTDGKKPTEVLKQHAKIINDLSLEDLDEIICREHCWVPAAGQSNKCTFGHKH